MDPRLKKYGSFVLKGFSILAPLFALGFVITKIWSVQSQIIHQIDSSHAILIILVGSIFYALANIFLVLAWLWLVDWLANSKTSLRTALKIYGRTQITKYIPGNVLHYPSRHLLGIQSGLTHNALLGAAFFEVVGLFVSASILSLLAILVQRNQVIPLQWVLVALGLSLFSPFVVHTALSRLPYLKKIGVLKKSVLEIYTGLASTWLLYLTFFSVAGMILWIIAGGVDHSGFRLPFHIALYAYAVSWLAGTITPGAPAGAGVREAILILLLSRYIGEPASIAVALITRIVTILGDVYFYFFAQFLNPST